MTLTDQEVTASLVLLVCMAKADGVLHDDERGALGAALEGIDLPEGMTLDTLLEEDLDIEDYLGDVTRPEARQAIYRSAFSMAYADGGCSPEEQAMLDRIRETFAITADETTAFQKLFQPSDEARAKSYVKAIDDPEARDAAIRKETLKCAIVSAVLGAFPVPGLAIATDLAVVGLQVTLVRDIGQYYGHQIDKAAAKSLLLGVGVGTGARIAVTNICKFVPGFGSAVGAAASFASTYAIGKMAVSYFENGCKVDMETLKKAFKDDEKEGKEQYSKNKDVVAAKQKAQQKIIEQLASERKAGKISEADYEKKLSELA